MVITLAACGGGTETLDAAELEDQVTEEVERELDVEVDSVECPEDIEVDEGDTFECTAELEDGEEIEVEVEQLGDGDVRITVEAPEPEGLTFTRAEIEETIPFILAEQDEDLEDVIADCSDAMDEEFEAEDGETFICGVGGLTSGSGAAVEVTIDSSEPDGFTVELIEGSGVPSEDDATGSGGDHSFEAVFVLPGGDEIESSGPAFCLADPTADGSGQANSIEVVLEEETDGSTLSLLAGGVQFKTTVSGNAFAEDGTESLGFGQHTTTFDDRLSIGDERSFEFTGTMELSGNDVQISGSGTCLVEEG